jgi:hypothetical protein
VALSKLRTTQLPFLRKIFKGQEKLEIQCDGAAALAKAVTETLFPNLEVGIETCYLIQSQSFMGTLQPNKRGHLNVQASDYHARLIFVPDEQVYRVDTTPSEGGIKDLSLQLVRQIAQLFKVHPNSEKYLPHQDEKRATKTNQPTVPILAEARLRREIPWLDRRQRLVQLESTLNAFVLTVTSPEQQVGQRLQRRDDPADVVIALEREVILPLVELKREPTPELLQANREKVKELQQTLSYLISARRQLNEDLESYKRHGGKGKVKMARLNPKFQDAGAFFDFYPEYTLFNMGTMQSLLQQVENTLR